jgi:hypothetical protein
MKTVQRVRAADGIDAVAAARDLSRLTEDTMHEAVARAGTGGATWQEIGDALGASRQAAYQRFGRSAAPETSRSSASRCASRRAR